MAIPDYFQRNAVAISQAISGFDEHRLQSMLDDVCVGVTVGPEARNAEGRTIIDLLVRLLARLYPSIAIRDERIGDFADDISGLARRINPQIDLCGRPTIEVIVGTAKPAQGGHRTIFAGSNGWRASLSTRVPQGCGNSNNPFGAGLAACLAAAEAFRSVFLPRAHLDGDLELTVPIVGDSANVSGDVSGNVGTMVLAGAGAIGNAAAWALSRTEVTGSIEVVDHESIDLGNLQRYVLAERDDEKRAKACFVAQKFSGTLGAKGYQFKLAEFLQKRRHKIQCLLLALDSAKDRCAAQASLPCRIANAWTQPSDLGVSLHDFLEGACVSCLYLPDGKQKNEDEIVAEAFGVPERRDQIRELLYWNNGAPTDLLEAIAATRDIPIEKLMAFLGRPLRQLYTEGFCGGAVIPVGEFDATAGDVHVPLAHQSAMAGVLLAAAGINIALSASEGSVVARYDVMKLEEKFNVYPVAKSARGICVCQDKDYVDVYVKKYKVVEGVGR